jgi:hypothetical protein
MDVSAAKISKIIIKGKSTCRLRRKSSNEFIKITSPCLLPLAKFSPGPSFWVSIYDGEVSDMLPFFSDYRSLFALMPDQEDEGEAD